MSGGGAAVTQSQGCRRSAPFAGPRRYGALVSELLPNLDALIAELTKESQASQDARALATVAREAATEVALDAALAGVVAAWRRC